MIFETHAHYDDEAFDTDREELLLSMQDGGVETIVNIGADVASSKQTLEFCDKYHNLILYQNVTNMSELMRKCDVAISASGTTLYELSACGIPTICYILEDNQINGAESFEAEGIMVNAGDIRIQPDFFESVLYRLRELRDNYTQRIKMHEMSQKKIDGSGAIRLAQCLLLETY